jgi:ubiquinone/menaquinone biosynthesis C-methylase UbiE
MIKNLNDLHQEVPGNYYDHAISKNLFQRFWHKKRFREASKYLKTINATKILDVGCHGGTFSNIVQRENKQAEMYGVDISKQAIEYANRRFKHIKFSVGSAENLPFKDKYFDFVTCFEVLEHIEEPALAIREAYRVLSKNGNYLIIVPTENLIFRVIWLIWTKFGPGRIWKHTHVQKFTDKKLDAILKKNRFNIINRNTFLIGMLLIIQAQKK